MLYSRTLKSKYERADWWRKLKLEEQQQYKQRQRVSGLCFLIISQVWKQGQIMPEKFMAGVISKALARSPSFWSEYQEQNWERRKKVSSNTSREPSFVCACETKWGMFYFFFPGLTLRKTSVKELYSCYALGKLTHLKFLE